MADLLSELRAHLITEGIVRDPATPGAQPPMWLQPRDGVPAPGEGPTTTAIGQTAVLGAFRTGGIPRGAYASWGRLLTVDITFRTTTAPAAVALDEQIRAVLVDRRDWMMGALHVIECLPWREFQPVGSDRQSFDALASYVFEVYSSSDLYPAA